MNYSFDKLWKILKERKISIKEFMEKADISKFYIKKLKENYYINWIVIIKISRFLNCHFTKFMTIS